MVEPMSKNENGEGKGRMLFSRQEIIDYAKISKHLYLKFIKMGMPVLYIDGRCYAHTDNLDEFFRVVTRSNAKNLPDDVINAVD
jgi:hypothetical protein